jgi:hypothetical protein
MNANSMVSLATARSCGSSGWLSGHGCRYSTSVPVPPAPRRSVGTGMRSRRFSRKSRQAFVAIRYSQVRSDARPWKDSRLAHARRKVSWVMSCASSYDASIR